MQPNHTLPPKEKERIVNEIVSFFNGQVEDAAIVYLFGSFVGDGKFSDVDLGIVTFKRVQRLLDVELEIESRLERIIKCPADVRVLNNAPVSFIQNVIRSGRVILDRDPSLRADFEGNALKQYFDFSRFRDQYLKEVLNAPI
jgi:predicted nucleotidyltransferase